MKPESTKIASISNFKLKNDEPSLASHARLPPYRQWCTESQASRPTAWPCAPQSSLVPRSQASRPTAQASSRALVYCACNQGLIPYSLGLVLAARVSCPTVCPRTPQPRSRSSQPGSRTSQPKSCVPQLRAHALQPGSRSPQPGSCTLQPRSQAPQLRAHASQPRARPLQPRACTSQLGSGVLQPKADSP